MFFSKYHILRCNNPFFLYIIIAMYYCNNSSNKFLYRFIYTYNIRILFLSIWSNYPFNISIINRIIHIFMLRMITSKWSVNHYFYNIANPEKIILNAKGSESLRTHYFFT